MLTRIDAERFGSRLDELEARQAELERIFGDPLAMAQHLLRLVRQAGSLEGPIAQRTRLYTMVALAEIGQSHPTSPN